MHCYDVFCSSVAVYSQIKPSSFTSSSKTIISGDATISGNPETQSVSIAGRRSANKGRGLFLTVAFFSVRLSLASLVSTACWWFIFYFACCAFLRRLRVFAPRWQVLKVRSPQDDAFLRDLRKVHYREASVFVFFCFLFCLFNRHQADLKGGWGTNRCDTQTQNEKKPLFWKSSLLRDNH